MIVDLLDLVMADATIYIDPCDSELADQYGVSIAPGWQRITYTQAVSAVHALNAAIASGCPYKWTENRLRALRNSLSWAFGPEFEEVI